jgi:hypothetical protein
MITDFLKTKISKTKLKNTLEVLKKFKQCESLEEWMGITFMAWAKLEQLEEFLEHMVNNKELKEDTIEYMKQSNSVKGEM